MRFVSASLKNFGSYGPNEQVVDLSENGVKLLVAPNGFGKSTLFYSIVYTIYGKTNQDSVDDVVNRKVKKNCKTSVEFYEDGILYKIIRYRKHEEHDNNVYIFKGDVDISLRKVADTNQLILDIIKMPYQAFINSTFFSTELYSRFMIAKTSERLSVFENLLSLKEVNAYYDKGKKLRALIKEKLDVLNVAKASKNAEMSSIDSNIKDYASRAKETLLSLRKEKETLLSLIEENKKKIEEYSSIDVEAELNNNKNKSRVESLLSQKRNKEESYETISVEKASDEDLAFLTKVSSVNIEEEKSKENNLKELKEKIESLAKEIDSLKVSKNDVEGTLISFNNDISTSEIEINDIEIQQDKLKDNICIYCGQHISDDFIKEKEKELDDRKEAYIKRIKSLKTEKEKISLKLDPMVSELSEKEQLLHKLETEKSLIILAFDSTVENVLLRVKDIENNVSFYNKELKRVEETNKKIKEEIERIDSEISDINYVPKYSDEFLIDLKGKIEELDKEIKKYQSSISEIDGKIFSVFDKSFVDSQKKKISKISKEVEVIVAEENVLKEDDFYYSYLMNCFSNKENSFKKFFIGQMIETFNEKINQYLPFFFEENITINFDKELECEIIIDKEKVSIKSFSAGQKTRADLAVAFALFSLSRIFFSNESNLLIVDEILDTNIDVYGIESALTIVEGFGYDTSVFVVSHNQDIKDKIKNKIEITRDENKFSIIK